MVKIPRKNYIILVFIALITVVITICLSMMYKKSHETNYTSVMEDFLAVITTKDFDSYIMENPNMVIYIGDSKASNYKSFEQDFKNELTNYDIQKYFVYLDINDITDSFKVKLLSNYSVDIDNYQIPMLLFFNENKIVDVVSSVDYSIDELIGLLEKNGVLD